MAPYADSAGYMDDAAEERKTESHDLLKEYASGLWHKQIACKAVSMIGDPKAEIVRKVQETHADVLIMGSRNMGTIRRFVVVIDKGKCLYIFIMISFYIGLSLEASVTTACIMHHPQSSLLNHQLNMRMKATRKLDVVHSCNVFDQVLEHYLQASQSCFLYK